MPTGCGASGSYALGPDEKKKKKFTVILTFPVTRDKVVDVLALNLRDFYNFAMFLETGDGRDVRYLLPRFSDNILALFSSFF
jgi:hypothetical protein